MGRLSRGTRKRHNGDYMTFIRTFFGTLFGLLGLTVFTIFFGILTILFAWVTPSGKFATWCCRSWARCWLLFSGVRVHVSFEEALDPTRSYVVLSNHASWFDIPALLSVLPGNVRFVAKRGLFQVPIFGWALKAAGFISVDRSAKGQGRKVLAAATEQLQGGGSVVLFPEGTRTSDGSLLPFRRGGFFLAMKSGMPLVPIGISGSLSVMSRSTLLIRPGVIEVGCGSLMDPSSYESGSSEQLSAEVREAIARLAKVAEISSPPVRKSFGTNCQ